MPGITLRANGLEPIVIRWFCLDDSSKQSPPYLTCYPSEGLPHDDATPATAMIDFFKSRRPVRLDIGYGQVLLVVGEMKETSHGHELRCEPYVRKDD